MSEGLAYVSDGIKYGYVDIAGKMCIPLTFDRAGSFRGGLARVAVGDCIAYIDRGGAIVWSSPSRSPGEWTFADE